MRPIVKIGLIAPFEGLYRESGYAALEAMRRAMAECTPAGVDVLPVALDDSGDPMQAQRAAQKLLVDPAVKAVVGPLFHDAVPAVSRVMTEASGVAWFVPMLVAPEGGFADPQASAWLTASIEFVAREGLAQRVLVAGLSAEWLLPLPPVAVRVDDLEDALATVGAGDALLWLGRPDVGARWLDALLGEQPDLSVWLANPVGGTIFVAHTADFASQGELNKFHWLIWRDLKYNQWSQSDDSATQSNDATQALVYGATCHALAAFANAPEAEQTEWQLQSRPVAWPNSE